MNKSFFLALTIPLIFSVNLTSKSFQIWKNNENSQENIQKEDKAEESIKVDNLKDIFTKHKEPNELELFRISYPDLIFKSEYNEELKDWKISLEIPDESKEGGYRKAEFYWAKGSLLPESELKNKDNYWSLLYHYDYHTPLADPADFTSEQIKEIKKFGSDENRKNGAGTPMFFFDELYQSYNQVSVEEHIIKSNFLGKRINIHERLKIPLQKVEEKIKEAALTDSEIQKFIDSINRNEGYNWRLIAGTKRKSFHCLGVALDIIPKSYRGKSVFWSWTKDLDPENWMLTPLKDRWMPPQKVINIFEDQGFIWGGKWIIFDNMHFEYHPELINYAKKS
ncbi:MAG: M15 family metallopeptidase [Treponema sp.]|nr:M15 family metallopeptidase [Treponema sp.]